MKRLSFVFLSWAFGFYIIPSYSQLSPVPPEHRGSIEAERRGMHSVVNLRIEFWNFGKAAA